MAGTKQPGTSAAPAAQPEKSIVLFSDGTGNSSAKLFKTNVWRMYEAVDLGPSPRGERDQIAYYDDGVGTSSFKPLAILGGVFGVGLKRNLLDIYKYACRNYRAGEGQEPGDNPDGLGDHLYAFGFSRGAFTMRLVVSLLATEGIVQYVDESDLSRKAADAYRRFCSDSVPRRHPARELAWGLRKLRAGAIWAWRKIWGHEVYDRSRNYYPVIRFVGVWDTVSAYGGPVTELTRAIDNWIWPLSMPNYQLNQRIGCARHALALDDERDSFSPLLWDEVAESEREREARHAQKEALERVRKARTLGDRAAALGHLEKACAARAEKFKYRNRLQQVWFTGMHADVGGGYPDESLSYVSLLWMIEQAELAGLRTLEVVTERYLALANSYGPIHDSRAGLGAYYRYQPRKVAAWIEPTERGDRLVDETLSLRDPAITDTDRRARGLLLRTRVHESVIARIATGTDKYAPLSLPRDFEIIPAGRLAEQQPQAVAGGALTRREQDSLRRRNNRLVAEKLRKRLCDPAVAELRADRLERVWNYVWLRRIVYFLTLAVSLLLASMPLWVGRAPEPPLLADGRTWIGGIIRLLAVLAPSFAGDWIKVYADNPFYFLSLGASILVLYLISSWLERLLRDRARSAWHRAVGTEPETAPAAATGIRKALRIGSAWLGTRLRIERNSYDYQRMIQLFKWRLLPDFVFGPMLVAVAAWIGLSLYTQMMLPGLENGRELCTPAKPPIPDLTSVRRDFATSARCSASLGRVQKGHRYVVTFDVVDQWYDGSLPASPEGVEARAFPWGLGYIAVPLRRVIDASYLQPIVEIRPRRVGGLFGNVRVDMLQVSAEGDSPNLYRGEFVARKSGELFVFANDAMLPRRPSRILPALDYDYFYKRSGGGSEAERGNRGSACLTVEAADVAGEPMGPPPPDSVCAKAATRAAEAAKSTTAAGSSGGGAAFGKKAVPGARAASKN